MSSVHVDGVARTEDWLTERAVEGLLYAKTYEEVRQPLAAAATRMPPLLSNKAYRGSFTFEINLHTSLFWLAKYCRPFFL